MISQADVIRTLVNKNCTDEAILTTALSPNCTPAKLLEKFTEAERFDLALDVSMKLGLDTAPLWRTWAMRCLQHRKFQAAREKFKFCFQRLKSLPGRTSVSSVHRELLTEILMELVRMEENELSLNEEIDLIKKQSFTVQTSDEVIKGRSNEETLLDKPSIYNEFKYYLQEYGTIQDHIIHYVKYFLWDSLISALIDNQDSLVKDNFFITHVFIQTASSGHLDDLISGFLKRDKNLDSSRQYFQSIYDYCTIQRRYNLLDYIQHKIGDYVAAAESQINHHFLRTPIYDYKELSLRLTSLMKAIEYYRAYMRKLSDKKHSISMKNDLKRKDVVKNELYSEMSYFNVEKRISTIELQIEITKNFALNEISGCMNEFEPKDYDPDTSTTSQKRCAVTLLDRSERRKTFLTALVLIYFDPECKSYFSTKGFELAKHLMHKLQLNKLDVFKTAMRIIIEDESCDIHDNTAMLLSRLKQDYDEDIKLMTKHPMNSPLRKISLQPLNKTNKTHVHGAKILTQRNENVSLFSNNSILSTTTTTSSSSTSSSCSPPLSTAGIGITNTRPQLEIERKSSIKAGSASATVKWELQQKKQPCLSSSSSAPIPVIIPNRHNDSPFKFSQLNEPLMANIIDLDDPKAKQPSTSRLASSLKQTSTLATTPITTQNDKSMLSFCMFDSARALCDEVIRDSIKWCQEADYKMELAKLLSPKAKIELYLELGKLSNAQRLAFNMMWPEYVVRIIEEAEKLNQYHVKIVCEHWLAKHESQNSSQHQRHQ